MSHRFYSLSELKHFYITPLQEAWQDQKLVEAHPAMEPVLKSYRKIYPTYGDAVVTSLDEREALALDDNTLTYGETRWSSFLKAMEHVPFKAGQEFIDLGCGTGFLCCIARVAFGLKATGYDLMEAFIDNAQSLQMAHQIENLHFKQEDFFKANLSQGDVFYITCTCFPESYMQRLSQKLSLCKKGSYFITITQALKGEAFEKVKTLSLPFSWGKEQVFIQRRK